MTATATTAESRFDFIIVGSGAGGGPLAARLARADFNVLLLEAGPDHHGEGGEGSEVSLVPGYHAVSSEHPDLSWRFWVKHYDNPPSGKDPKCHPKEGQPPSGDGIFYPRAAGLGGCTVHNAMITIAGPDADWEDLADFLGDDSWRGAPMRAYFQRLERNEYQRPPAPIPTRWWGRLRDIVTWLFGFTPDHTRGRHGFDGWLHTSVTDVKLGLGDRQLLRVLKGALRQARHARLDRGWSWVRRFLSGTVTEGLDPNHARTQAESPDGVVMVPLAVCGKRTTIHQNSATPFVMRGRRSSPREFLLETKASHPDTLTIRTDVLVTRVLFDERGETPRAVGVSFLEGRRLYSAHPNAAQGPGRPDTAFVRPGGEVILCGGAFNTPQLLMLSGIGDTGHLADVALAGGDPDGCTLRDRDEQPLPGRNGEPARIHLPGVGCNLQDRYEVTVISQMAKPFSILDGATFELPATGNPDRHLKEWRDAGTGLYTSNGAVLGVLKRSDPFLEQPDLFIFGVPLPFYGYDIGYSKAGHIHDQFTWAVLKGRTRNADGQVCLRSLDPRDTPAINFHYFNEATCPGGSADDPDLQALVDGVKFVRGAARRANRWYAKPVRHEIHPGLDLVPDGDDEALKAWIRRDAWGHHACGTCRMGPDGDPDAVLDSRFRVRGVDGLRVVDASIFPRIPGYFIVTNIYMASEKAADVIVQDHAGGPDRPEYPQALRALEAEALAERRTAVAPAGALARSAAGTHGGWAADVAGLALSGGGIRSATFNLGVLQALARGRCLRRVDFLSTVSGGGYIGSFLGRWYDRLRPQSKFGGTDRHPEFSAADEIERELLDAESPALAWLRRHGNYIAPGGRGDRQVNSAVFVRNFLSVHFVITTLLLVIFGLANGVRYGLLETGTGVLEFAGITPTDLPLGRLLVAALGVFYSSWFLIFEAVVLFMVIPRIVAYWIVSQRAHERYEGVALLATLVASAALLFASVQQQLDVPLVLLALAPLSAIVHVEMAWWRGHDREEAIGSGSVETQRLRTRNYLTYDLGVALALAATAAAFAVVDTIGHAAQQYAADNQVYVGAIASFMAGVAALAPVIRMIANLFAGDERQGTASTLPRPSRQQIVAGVAAVVIGALPLVFVSFLSHVAYGGGTTLVVGLAVTAMALVLSIVFAHRSALTLVNRSSLAQTYAARLARAYLGATNPVRSRPHAANVTEVVAGDDVSAIDHYRPYKTGGPLHLLNLMVNQTVDFTSLRGNRDRQGENLAVSPFGLSVGTRYHAAWAARPDTDREKRPATLLPIGHLRGTEHPLVDEQGHPASQAEMLSLQQWMGISGAAVGPGRGQTTKLGTALLFGLANLRTGHWWDSGLPPFARDGLPKLTLTRRIGYLLHYVFQVQGLLLSEWVARFPGPWGRFWYLSDGGFFENLGAYELIRRRVPRIIVSDATGDPTYELDDFANLVRKARIDFDAEIMPFGPADYAAAGVPSDVVERLGTLDELRPRVDAGGRVAAPSQKHAALFWVEYGKSRTRGSVLLYLKATLTGDEGADVAQYARAHPRFPHEPTSDQSFDERQWESYRRLGEHVALPLCADPEWFWRIPVTELS